MKLFFYGKVPYACHEEVLALLQEPGRLRLRVQSYERRIQEQIDCCSLRNQVQSYRQRKLGLGVCLLSGADANLASRLAGRLGVRRS